MSSAEHAELFPVWTYADESECLQTHYNVAALYLTEKGTSIDTGRPSGKVEEGQTCAQKGYTVARPHEFDDLPKLIKAAYTGVSSWAKPETATAAIIPKDVIA